MMKRAGCFAMVLVAGIGLYLGAALACDDHVGKCELEAWRVVPSFAGIIHIEGTATCNKGDATIRIYQGDTFVGTAHGFIQGHALSATAMKIPDTRNLTIKYSIEPE